MSQSGLGSVDSFITAVIKRVTPQVDPQMPFHVRPAGTEVSEKLNFKAFCHNVLQQKHRAKESHYVQEELAKIKRFITDPESTARELSHCLLHCFLCHLLGYKVDFAHILAVNLAQRGNLSQKRLGYLACKLFLPPGHQMRILLVNSVLQDMMSRSEVVIITGLTAAAELVDREMITAVLPAVMKRIQHFHPAVRRRAAICLHSFVSGRAEWEEPLYLLVEAAAMLEDKDWGVVWAAVPLLRDTFQQTPDKDYVERVARVLVIKLSALVHGWDSAKSVQLYMGLREPWLQVEIIRTMSVCIQHDLRQSHHVHKILAEIMELLSDKRQFIAVAILQECVRTVCAIEHSENLLNTAVQIASHLLSINDKLVKHAGLEMFRCLSSVKASLLSPHQVAIVECLKDEHEMIRNTAFRLMFSIANPSNVGPIIASVCQTADKYKLSSSVFLEMIDVSTKHAPSGVWLLQNVRALFALADSKVKSAATIVRDLIVVDNLIQQLSKEKGKDEGTWQQCIDTAWDYLLEDNIPTSLLLLCIWAVCDDITVVRVPPEEVIERVVTLIQRLDGAEDVRCRALILLRKLISCTALDGESDIWTSWKSTQKVSTGLYRYNIDYQIFQEIEIMHKDKIILSNNGSNFSDNVKNACQLICDYSDSKEDHHGIIPRKQSLTIPNGKEDSTIPAPKRDSISKPIPDPVALKPAANQRCWSSDGLKTNNKPMPTANPPPTPKPTITLEQVQVETIPQENPVCDKEEETKTEQEAAAIFAGIE